MKLSAWDKTTYFFLFILAVWLLLKVTGVINTPIWLEYGVPLGSAIIAFATFIQGMNEKFVIIANQMGELKANDARLESKLNHLDRDVERIKDELVGLHTAIRS